MRVVYLIAVILTGLPGYGVCGEVARDAVRLFHQQHADAAQALGKAAEANPSIATALAVLQAESLLMMGQRKQALELASGVVRLDSRWAHRAAWVAARAAAGQDCKSAGAFLNGVRVDPPWIQGAELLALKASVAERCGQKNEAAIFERELATRFPLTPEGRAATGRIELKIEDRLARAKAMEVTGDYTAAEAELTGLLRTEASHEARFRLARLHLERVREDYDLAWRIFSELADAGGPRSEESAWLRGKALGRKGDVVGAIGAFESYLSRFPQGEFADDAEFFRAFLLYENGRFMEASKAFGAIMSGSWVPAAAWYGPWCLFLAGEAAKAQPIFEQLARNAKSRRLRRKALYWSARAAEVGAPAKARLLRKELVQAKPHDWYGLMARRRFPDEFKDVPGLPKRVKLKLLDPPRGFRKMAREVRSLMNAGLGDFARRALAEVSGRLRAADLWAVEASLAAEVGDASRLYISTISRHRDLTEKPPKPRDTARWRGTYPLAYENIVEPVAEDARVSPMLIYSFMRTESAFNPDAVSPAHAVGLMQLLPRTARRIVQERTPGESTRTRVRIRSSSVDLTPRPDLFNPQTNVELGTWYVAALERRFKGQLPLVAAAYNAGPRSVVGWCRNGAMVDTDIFVERIPFRETRRYVKKMVETRTAYALVHEGQSLGEAADMLPTSLNLRVAPGVTF